VTLFFIVPHWFPVATVAQVSNNIQSHEKLYTPWVGPTRARRSEDKPGVSALPIRHFRSVLAILLPWMPMPAISPFWPKTKA
jgi:hypothetical protein